MATTKQDILTARQVRGRKIANAVLLVFGAVMVATMLWVVMTVLDAIL